MNEDLKKIFEGMDLSADFMSKFEGIYTSRIQEETTRIEEEAQAKYKAISEDYAKYVVAETEEKADAYIKEEVIPSVEKYIDYVSKEFIAENKLVIESEAKVEMADKFLSGFTAIAEQYNVSVPKGQDDLVAIMQKNIDEANAEIKKVISKNAELSNLVVENKKSTIVSIVTADLTETQREKIVESAKKISFIDDTQFTTVVKELKESYAPKHELKEELHEVQTTNNEAPTDTWMDALLSRV